MALDLFFDDIRQPPIGMVQCKNIEEAIQHLCTGLVEFISFSFDLRCGESGYDLALWIEKSVRNHSIPFPDWCIHSADQSGRERITHVMNATSRYWYSNNPPPSGSEVMRFGDEWRGIRALIVVSNFESENQKKVFIQNLRAFLAKSGWMYGSDLAGILIASNPNDLVAHVYESHIYAKPLSEIEHYLIAQEQIGISTECSPLLTLGACIAINRAEDVLIWRNMEHKTRSVEDLADTPGFLRKTKGGS